MVRRILVVFIALGIGTFGVACSSNDAGTTNVCDQKAAVEQSFQELTQVNVVTDGTDALKSAFDNVKTQVEKLASVAKDQFQSEISAMRSALSGLGSAVSNLPEGAGLSEAASSLASAVSQVSTAASDLKTALDDACG